MAVQGEEEKEATVVQPLEHKKEQTFSFEAIANGVCNHPISSDTLALLKELQGLLNHTTIEQEGVCRLVQQVVGEAPDFPPDAGAWVKVLEGPLGTLRNCLVPS